MNPIWLITALALASGLINDVFGLHLRKTSDRAQLARFFQLSNETNAEDGESDSTRWAVLVAGSSGFDNYRHQADICHAYQLLKNGGLKDENIIVFMYDDIADDEENLEPGKIFNRPGGPDVYRGVPKDYTGENATAANFYAALLGNKSALTGGSGKVVESGPNDYIFVYYADHGGEGAVGMPVGPYVYAHDLNKVLKQKHAAGAYKQLVFYMEACESGAMFKGLLGRGLNIYAITAANEYESSWAYYCPSDGGVDPSKYSSCLGDLFSISWMEDVEKQERDIETLEQDFELVKEETAHPQVTKYYGSHVQRFGDINLSSEHIDIFMGENKGNASKVDLHIKNNLISAKWKPVNQHDAGLLHFEHKVRTAPAGTKRQSDAQKELDEVLEYRRHIDRSMSLIGGHLFGVENVHRLKSVDSRRDSDKAVVDDWDCLKDMVRTFEIHCGSMSQYGLKYLRYLANFCNAGVDTKQMIEASTKVCTSVPKSRWTSLAKGFSA